MDMKNNQVCVWTAAQQSWLEEARAGNEKACNNLFCSMKSLLETVHRYSQDGLHPSRFGYDYNYSGRTFEQASGDIYIAFRGAVLRFDPTQGVPFGAYAVSDLRHRAMDWTRERKKDRHVVVGQRMDDGSSVGGEYCVLTQGDYDVSVNSFYEERSDSLCNEETHPVEACEIMDMVARIRSEVVTNDDSRLVEFVEKYLECCSDKKAMELVAEHMGVTRAMAYVYLDKLRALILPKYGSDFGVAA